jgi:hypothetical protein
MKVTEEAYVCFYLEIIICHLYEEALIIALAKN